MTDDLKERLGVYGQPGKRGSDHPHSVVCRDALARITELEAHLAAAEADRDKAREYAAQARIRENKAEVARVSAEVRALRAEAGEDALAEALRGFDEHIPCGVVECHGDKCREPWCASCFGWEEADKYMGQVRAFSDKAAAALAAYDARRG